MKTLKCDLCEVTADGETFKEWMSALHPHYMKAHTGLMKEHGEKSVENQKEDMDNWMAENKARFDTA